MQKCIVYFVLSDKYIQNWKLREINEKSETVGTQAVRIGPSASPAVMIHSENHDVCVFHQTGSWIFTK